MTAALKSEIVAAVLAKSLERCRSSTHFGRPPLRPDGPGAKLCVRTSCNRPAGAGGLCLRHAEKGKIKRFTRW